MESTNEVAWSARTLTSAVVSPGNASKLPDCVNVSRITSCKRLSCRNIQKLKNIVYIQHSV